MNRRVVWRQEEILLKPHVRQYEQDTVHIEASSLGPPVVTYIGPGNRWRLEQEYVYQDDGSQIRVPAGFEFDLASVPRAFWWLISPFELSVAAPLVHDFLYRYAGEPPTGSIDPPRLYTRAQADDLFGRMMEEEGVPAWRRVLARRAVGLFGWLAWRKGQLA